MGRPSLREVFIETGVSALHEHGFAGSAIRDLTSAAGVPLGSFTNHFRSKEAFAVAVLERYMERTEIICEQTLDDETRQPLQRLMAYFDVIIDFLDGVGWRQGCMISNLSLEMADQSESLRDCLRTIFSRLTVRFSEAVNQAQLAGEVRTDVPAEELADLMLSAWHGAMLRMKVDRSSESLDRFKSVFVTKLLAPTAVPTRRKPLSSA